jgi:hypothetical protein
MDAEVICYRPFLFLSHLYCMDVIVLMNFEHVQSNCVLILMSGVCLVPCYSCLSIFSVLLFKGKYSSRAISQSSCTLRSPLADNMGCWIKNKIKIRGPTKDTVTDYNPIMMPSRGHVSL